jgi:hypothetical protein
MRPLDPRCRKGIPRWAYCRARRRCPRRLRRQRQAGCDRLHSQQVKARERWRQSSELSRTVLSKRPSSTDHYPAWASSRQATSTSSWPNRPIRCRFRARPALEATARPASSQPRICADREGTPRRRYSSARSRLRKKYRGANRVRSLVGPDKGRGVASLSKQTRLPRRRRASSTSQ